MGVRNGDAVLNIDRTIIQFDNLVNAGRALNTSSNGMLFGAEKFLLYTGCQL